MRPRGYGELLDLTIELYRQNFLCFAGISALTMVPVTLLLQVDKSSFLILNLTIGILVQLVCYSALIVATARAYLNRPTSPLEVYRIVWRRLGSYMVLMVRIGRTVLLYTLLLLVPGVLASLRLAFASEAFWIEGLRGQGAMERSTALTAQSFTRLILLGILTYSIYYGAYYGGYYGIYYGLYYLLHGLGLDGIVTLLYSPQIQEFYRVGFAVVSVVVLTPMVYVPNVLLYFDVRIRREGFDVQVLAEALDHGRDSSVRVVDGNQ